MDLRLFQKLLEGAGPRGGGKGKKNCCGGGDGGDHGDDDADGNASTKSFDRYDVDATYHMAKDTDAKTSKLTNPEEAERGIEEKGVSVHPAFSRSENNLTENAVALYKPRSWLERHHLACSMPDLSPLRQHDTGINTDKEEIIEGSGGKLTFIMNDVPISKKVGSPRSPPNEGGEGGGMEMSPSAEMPVATGRYPQPAIPPPPPRSTKCKRRCSLPHSLPSRQPSTEQLKVHTEADEGRASAAEFPGRTRSPISKKQMAFPPPPPKAKYDRTSSMPCSLPSRQPRLGQLNADNEEDADMGELQGSSHSINNTSETMLKTMHETDCAAFINEECREKKNEKNNNYGESLNSNDPDELPSRHHHANDAAKGQEVFPKKGSEIAIPPPPRRPCRAKPVAKKFGKDNEDTIARVVDTSPSTKSIVDLSTRFEEIDTVATLAGDTRSAAEEDSYASLSLSDLDIGGSGNISKLSSFPRLLLCTNDKGNHNRSPPRRSRKPRNMSLSSVPECSTKCKQIASEPKQQLVAKNRHNKRSKKQSPQLKAYPSPTNPLDRMPPPQRKKNGLEMPPPLFHPPPPPLHSRKLPFPPKEGPNINGNAKCNANRSANVPTAKLSKEQRRPPPRCSSNEAKSAKFINSISSSMNPPPPPSRRKPSSRNGDASGTLASGSARTSNATSNHSSAKSSAPNAGSDGEAMDRRSTSDDRHRESKFRQRRGKPVLSVRQGKKSGNPNKPRLKARVSKWRELKTPPNPDRKVGV